MGMERRGTVGGEDIATMTRCYEGPSRQVAAPSVRRILPNAARMHWKRARAASGRCGQVRPRASWCRKWTHSGVLDSGCVRGACVSLLERVLCVPTCKRVEGLRSMLHAHALEQCNDTYLVLEAPQSRVALDTASVTAVPERVRRST
eukprot:1979144-Prymnesium_polylepis.1